MDSSVFFNISHNDIIDLVLEPNFLLAYYCGFSLSDVYNMPIAYKRWYLERVQKEIQQSSDNGQTQTRAAHQNTPEIRNLQNKSRAQVPAKLRRFT